MPGLGAAYWGYIHQDIITAFALASLVSSGATAEGVTADRKRFPDDCFDDLVIERQTTTRGQIKAHSRDVRPLQLADFTTDSIDFRIDRALASMRADQREGSELRLLTTFDRPDPSLLPYLIPVPARSGLLPALRTDRYVISVDAVWPMESGPVWPHLESASRAEFKSFCDSFVVETKCPRGSGDLRVPGVLETELMRLLRDRIGVSLPPNEDRDVADAAAHLIYRAQVLRANGDRADSAEVIRTLALRIDYGRVSEDLRVDDSMVVSRGDVLDELRNRLDSEKRVVIIGPPGCGKSWLMRLLRNHLLNDGWLAVLHYCFLDVWDSSLGRRSSSDVTFGSLIAELLDLDPSVASVKAPRYSAGPFELEQILQDLYASSPDRHVAVIVDGLDHADRSGGRLGQSSAALAYELTALNLPPNVVLVIGSQPGPHLDDVATAPEFYEVPQWSRPEIEELIRRAGLDELPVSPPTLRELSLADVIVDRAAGNPLYATYLSKSAMYLRDAEPGLDSRELAVRIGQAPVRDIDLASYYGWLLSPFSGNEGAKFVMGMLAAAGFTLTGTEIGEIVPPFAHHIEAVLRQLAPVLTGGAAAQGVRIYHESFQRYCRDTFLSTSEELRAAMDPIIEWLSRRGFLHDQRAFRFLPELLTSADRDGEVMALITEDYVAACIRRGFPGDAATRNLSIGGRTAGELEDWTTLARFVELARAADLFYNWRLDDDDLAEQYGRALLSLLGAEHLVAALEHEGRCTFRPRPGLILCHLCAATGVLPPWNAYVEAYDRFRKSDNTVYSGGDGAVHRAWVAGRFHQAGPESAIELAIQFNSDATLRLHPYDIALTLGDIYGVGAVIELRDRSPEAVKAWVQLSLAALSVDQAEREAMANAAIGLGLPISGVSVAKQFGADMSSVPFDLGRLDGLTLQMCDTRSPDPNVTTEWLAGLDIASARGDVDQLLRSMLSISGDFWYRRWLRFAVALRRESDLSVLLRDLRGLSQDFEIFEGEPRVVDLFQIHDHIRGSFEVVLRRAQDDQWIAAVDILARISRATIAWVASTRSGPLPVDELLEMCARTANNERRRQMVSELATKLLESEEATSEVYDTHALDQLLRARLLVRSNNESDAWRAWDKASAYLAAYGFRKDITVYELLDALPALAAANLDTRIECLKRTQVLSERLLNHTDLSETSGAIHRWIDHAALLDSLGCLVQVARESLLGVPTVGALEHAIPIALKNLGDRGDPLAVALGWLAAGPEVLAASAAAVSAFENLAGIDRSLQLACWSTTAASLVGDGPWFDADASAVLIESARRMGLDAPKYHLRPSPAPESSARIEDEARISTGELPSDFQLLSRAQLLSTLRRLRTGREQIRPDVAEKVASWLSGRSRTGPFDPRAVLQNIAEDTKSFYPDPFLTQLAQLLEDGRQLSLSAACWTLAYTRATDGWRRFGGEKHHWMFRRALEVDSSEAWRTLAREVGAAVAMGGPFGVNVHTIQLLALAHRDREAVETWDACCSAIEYRVPPTVAGDFPHVEYGSMRLSLEASIVAVAIGRMNHFDVDQRRQAMAALASLIATHPAAVAEAISATFSELPDSVGTAVIALLDQYEPKAHPVTMAAQTTLSSAASGPNFTVGVLARSLLLRAGLGAPDPPPSRIPEVVMLSGPALSINRSAFGHGRLRPVEELWPPYGDYAASWLATELKSQRVEARMKAMRSHVGVRAIVGHSSLWWPIDEEIERALQLTAYGLRAGLALEGRIGTDADEEVARHLIGDVDVGARLAMSRTARPTYHAAPKELPEYGTGDLITVVGDARYNGWIVLGYHERQLELSGGYDRHVVAQHDAWCGVVYSNDRRIGVAHGSLPVVEGTGKLWSQPNYQARGGSSEAPLVAIDISRDTFGVIQILGLAPHTGIGGDLRPGRATSGLSLVDDSNEPVVCGRCWREPILGNEYVNDRVFGFVGFEVLVRPDIFRRMDYFAPATPSSLIVRKTSTNGGPSTTTAT